MILFAGFCSKTPVVQIGNVAVVALWRLVDRVWRRLARAFSRVRQQALVKLRKQISSTYLDFFT